MNRKDRRALQHEQHAFISDFPEKLTLLSPDEFPPINGAKMPIKAWKSRKYLVQLYQQQNADFPELLRLSVCRVKFNGSSWQDGLTWDELQAIKREVGFGGWYGVEVYPPDTDIVNVANFRHLWLLPTPLSIGWFK